MNACRKAYEKKHLACMSDPSEWNDATKKTFELGYQFFKQGWLECLRDINEQLGTEYVEISNVHTPEDYHNLKDD